MANISFELFGLYGCIAGGDGGCRDVTVTAVMVNHGKIPNGERYRLNFNYHGNRRGQ